MTDGSSAGEVDVLIVTAVKDECDAALLVDTGAWPGSKWEREPGPTGLEVAFRTFRSKDGQPMRVALTRALEMGGVATANAAVPLIERYKPKCLAMSGVCAGRRGEVELGDVIVADRLWTYDTGKLEGEVDKQGNRQERVQGDVLTYLIDPVWQQQAENFVPGDAEGWLLISRRAAPGSRAWKMRRLSTPPSVAILSDALEGVDDEYDYILIDCPPNLYLVTQNALAVSEAYIVTTLPDHLSTIGLKILYDRIKKLNKLLDYASAISENALSGPTLGGIIFVRMRPGGTRVTKAHVRKMNEIQTDYGEVVFNAYTTEGIGYGEASELVLPVFLIRGENTDRVADHYRQIGDEFLERYP